MAYNVTVKINHSCDLTNLNRILKKDFRVNCNGYFDQFIFDEMIPDNFIEEIKNAISYSSDPLHRIVNLEGQEMILFKCEVNDRAHLVHFYQPIVSHFGLPFGLPLIGETYELYNYHCLEPLHQQQVIGALQEVTNIEIVSNLEYPTDDFFGVHMFSTSEIASKLSSLQLTTLLTAYEEGYYEIPRKVKTSELAEKMGTTRYILENNLRSAENEIMTIISSNLL